MAYSAGVMKSFATHLKKPAADVAKWKEVIDRHVKLTASLYRADANWFCDYNSEVKHSYIGFCPLCIM
jgi:hypothetical protein